MRRKEYAARNQVKRLENLLALAKEKYSLMKIKDKNIQRGCKQ